jgi:hypothetical protein
MYEQARADLDAFQANLEPVARQVGAVFAINGAIVGLELSESAATWRKAMRKIVESDGLDTLDRQDARPVRARRDPRRFLIAASEAAVEKFPAVGLRRRPRVGRRGARPRGRPGAGGPLRPAKATGREPGVQLVTGHCRRGFGNLGGHVNA